MKDQTTLDGKTICLHRGEREICPSASMGHCTICVSCGKHIMEIDLDET